MKGFLIGLGASVALMMAFIYATIINPAMMTSLLTLGKVEKIEEIIDSTENEKDLETTSRIGMPSPTYSEHFEKGKRLMENKNYEEAVTEFIAATEIETERGEAYLFLGEAYFYTEDFVNAAQAFLEAKNRLDEPLEAELWLGKIGLAQGDVPQALEQFKSLKNLQTSNEEWMYYQALTEISEDDFASARIRLETLIQMNSNWSSKATSFLNAVTIYEQSQDPNPNYVKTLMARSFAETGEYSLAIHKSYAVLKEEPSYAAAWRVLGYSYLMLKNYEEAQEALFKAVELKPTNPETRYFLGLTYESLKDYPSAITQFELCIQSGFEPVLDVYRKIANNSVLIQDYIKALDHYKKVLTLDPSNINDFIRPLWIAIEHVKDLKQAQQWAEKAVEIHPNEGMSYNLLAWSEIAQEQWNKAEQHLNYALILDPNLAAAYLNLGILKEHQKDTLQAQEYYKRAFTLDPNGSVGGLAAERYNLLASSASPTQ